MMASPYSGRGRGRGGVRNVPQHSRPGLLGEAPGNMRPDLLDSLSAQSSQYHAHQQYETPPRESRPPMKQGLLGSAPPYARQKVREPHRERQQPYTESREFSYNSQNEYEGSAEEGELSHSYIDNLSPEVKQLISNLGLSKSDLEQLSNLPERELTANNFARIIRDLRTKKGHQQQQNKTELDEEFNSYSDRREISYRQKPVCQQSYSDPYEDEETKEYEDLYNEEEDDRQNDRVDDAFTSFQEKWYSDGGAKDKTEPRSRNGNQSQSSILRGSRGPAAKSSRWEKEEQQQNPPHSKVNKQTPKPSGLLGNPLNPSTQELDLLAATISSNRAKARQPVDRFQQDRKYQNHQQRNQRSDEYAEQERYVEVVQHEPPQAPQANAQVAMTQAMLEAQMKAMQVLQSEALQKQHAVAHGVRGLPGIPRSNYEDGKAAAIAQAHKEAEDMRLAQGRVVYIRYKSPIPSVLTEADLVDLASAFDKVTNILMVKPKTAKSMWHQAFLELQQSDGAAAMLEHYMIRPPTCKGILVQVQKSNYKTLKLREHQMERDIDELVRRQKEMKRRRSYSISPIRNKKSVAPSANRSRRSLERRRSNSSSRRDSGRDHKKTERRKRSRSRENAKRGVRSNSPDSKSSKSSQDKKHTDKKPSKLEKTYPAKSDKPSKVETKKSDLKVRKERNSEEKRREPEKRNSETKESIVDLKVLKMEYKASEPTQSVDKDEEEPESFTIVDSTGHNDSDEQENNEVCDAKEEGADKSDDNEQNKDVDAHTEEDANGEKVDTNADKKNHVLENIGELSSMSEALLMIVQKNSAKAVINDMMSIMSKTVEILHEIDV